MLELISLISSKLHYLLIKLLKRLDYFACNNNNTKDDKLNSKSQVNKGQYRIIMTYIGAEIIFRVITYIFNFIDRERFFIAIIVFSIHFFLIKAKKFWINNIYTIVIGILVTVQWCEFDRSIRTIFILPLMSINSAIYCMVMTSSKSWSIISFLATGYLLSISMKKRLAQDCLTLTPKDINEILEFTSIEFSGSFIIYLGLVFILIYNRQKLYNKIESKKKELEIANALLIEKNKMLENSLKRNEVFLLGLSHEIRNPINIIIGNMELALMTHIESNTKLFLENTKLAGEILLYIINNLLDFGKLQVSNLEISVNPTRTKEFIRKLWAITKILAKTKNLSGKIFVSKNIPPILMIDPHRVMQIIFNLVGNAVKFTEKGYVHILLKWDDHYNPHENLQVLSEKFQAILKTWEDDCEDDNNYKILSDKDIANNNNVVQNDATSQDMGISQIYKLKFYNSGSLIRSKKVVETDSQYFVLDENDSSSWLKYYDTNKTRSNQNKEGYLRFEIADSGCGIKEEDLNKLFNKFTQINDNDEFPSRQLGSGLGLWITKNLCNNMHGDIKAYSKVGEGSVFVGCIKCESFSRELLDSPNLNQIHKRTLYSTTLPNNKLRLKCMVVDDIQINQQISKYYLEKCGIEIIDIANNGLEAYEYFKSKGNRFFDIIFMDIEMPIMNGLIASTKIREYERLHNWHPVELVIITGNCNKEEFSKYLDPNGGVQANYAFSKPFTFQQCQDLIMQIKHKKIYFS